MGSAKGTARVSDSVPMNLTPCHRPKITIFVPQGRLVAPIHVKFGKTKGHVGPLAHTKFHSNRFMGWERGPKYQKFPLDLFLKFLRAFTRPTILHQHFKFDVIRFTGYGVIAEKPRVGHLGQFFRAPCRKKLCVGSKNECHLFNVMISTSSITMRSWGRSYNACRLQLRKYGVFFCHVPRPERCFIKGGIL